MERKHATSVSGSGARDEPDVRVPHHRATSSASGSGNPVEGTDGTRLADICYEPDVQRRQDDDFVVWRQMLGFRRWQGQHEGLDPSQAADIAIYLRGLDPRQRGITVANLAAMVGEILIDVSMIAANLVPEDDDMVQVEVHEEEEDERPGDGEEVDNTGLMQQSSLGGLQLHALLKSLNSISPGEARGKAAALLRRLHQSPLKRWPHALREDRPMRVEELEAALVAFTNPNVHGSEDQWSLSTNWANAWWEVFHAILGGSSSPSSAASEGPAPGGPGGDMTGPQMNRSWQKRMEKMLR